MASLLCAGEDDSEVSSFDFAVVDDDIITSYKLILKLQEFKILILRIFSFYQLL